MERQPIDEHTQPVVSERKPPKIQRFFDAMQKLGASDLHLKADAVPHFRTDSILRRSNQEPQSNEQIVEMAMELLTDKQQAYFLEHGSIDIAYEIPGSDRFRINIFRQRGDVSLAARRVTRDIPNFEDLHLPEAVGKIASQHQGLVLLSGPTGSGKSTTIAAMLEHINATRPCHVVTIEDPIEYLYEDKKALINQREIGIDVESFEAGLKYLMREDPDVVLIGEMRDRETFEAALQASETGHLVFGTVHASSAPQTVERLLTLFPTEARELIRQSLAFNLRAILCQRLLPSIAEGVGRVPAVEILMSNPSVRSLLEDGRDAEMMDVIRSNERDGMQTFTTSLLNLIESEFIDPKIAYEVAPNVDELKMRLKGISAGHSGLLGRG
jgi:twitching motility protein PilT